MDLRKWIVYSFCALAGLVLLAHAFIPHIHHDGGICFVKEHICGTSECGHGHKHDHGPLENCKLNDVQIRPEVNESITPDLSDQFLLNYQLILSPIEETLILSSLASQSQYKPYLLLYTSVLASSSHSLRAPPTSFRI